MIAEYTFLALAAPGALVALELFVLRTGLFRDLRYWAAVTIGLAFQVPVDGWLTRANDPIVVYAEREISGLRFPMNIPVEDFGFGFALITFTLLLWRRLVARAAVRPQVREWLTSSSPETSAPRNSPSQVLRGEEFPGHDNPPRTPSELRGEGRA